jgi:hypothetical protein
VICRAQPVTRELNGAGILDDGMLDEAGTAAFMSSLDIRPDHALAAPDRHREDLLRGGLASHGRSAAS